jgi:hypothetical protein
VYRDGSLSRRPERTTTGGGTQNAVAVWLADPGSDRLSSGSGKIVALPGIRSFGRRKVDASGRFMDYDGRFQDGPDITTRGMRTGPRTDPDKRYYLRVYPALTAAPLGPAAG